MPTEGRAAGPHVNRHIEHATAQDGHQLALRLRILDMQAAQDPLGRAREIILHEVKTNPALRVALLLEQLQEEAARVSEHLRLDDQHARNGGFDDVHRPSPAATPCGNLEAVKRNPGSAVPALRFAPCGLHDPTRPEERACSRWFMDALDRLSMFTHVISSDGVIRARLHGRIRFVF